MRTGHKKTTIYDTTTRSALEARWAIFFRELNLKWHYEPTTLRGGSRSYTPDFLLEGFGYVEIKPTLELFISESSQRIGVIANANPDIKIYAFCADRVVIQNTAMYEGDKIYAPTPQQIYKLLSHARTNGDRLTTDQQNADIQRSMTIANQTKLHEWQSVGSVLPELLTEFIRNLELRTELNR